MTKLTVIEGIGEAYQAKLAEAGITTTEALLEKGATRTGRQGLADSTGITSKLIMAWINHADLFRIKGISSQYADLLEVAGVDTVPALARRNPANLHEKMAEVNKEKALVRRPPAASQVEDWVTQAKELPRIVEY